MLFMKGNKQVKDSKMVLLVISFDVNICSKGTLTVFFPALANEAAEVPGSYLGLNWCLWTSNQVICIFWLCPQHLSGVRFFLWPDSQLTGQHCWHSLLCELLS